MEEKHAFWKMKMTASFLYAVKAKFVLMYVLMVFFISFENLRNST